MSRQAERMGRWAPRHEPVGAAASRHAPVLAMQAPSGSAARGAADPQHGPTVHLLRRVCQRRGEGHG